MKYIIVILVTLLSVFCFSIAEAQPFTPVSTFGNPNINGYSKAINTLWLTKYATTDTNKVLGIDSNGLVVWRTKSNASAGIDTNFVDSLIALNIKDSIIGYRVFIEGQSNCDGDAPFDSLALFPYTKLPYDFLDTFQRVYIWNYTAHEYQKLVAGYNNYGGAANLFGSELSIAARWEANNPDGWLFIEKKCLWGIPIASFQKGTAQYDTILANRVQSNAWLRARGFKPVDIGWYFIHGEANRTNTSAQYLAALNQLYNSKYSDNLIGTSTRLVISQVAKKASLYGAGVDSAQKEFVAIHALGRLVNNDSNTFNDGNHYDAGGYVQLGYAGYTKIFDADSITLKDTIVPVITPNLQAVTNVDSNTTRRIQARGIRATGFNSPPGTFLGGDAISVRRSFTYDAPTSFAIVTADAIGVADVSNMTVVNGTYSSFMSAPTLFGDTVANTIGVVAVDITPVWQLRVGSTLNTMAGVRSSLLPKQGAVINAVDFWARHFGATSVNATTTNHYGLQIDDFAGNNTATYNWGVAQRGTATKNWFAGKTSLAAVDTGGIEFAGSSPFVGANIPLYVGSNSTSFPFQNLISLRNNINNGSTGIRRLGIAFNLSTSGEDNAKSGAITYESANAFSNQPELKFWTGNEDSTVRAVISFNPAQMTTSDNYRLRMPGNASIYMGSSGNSLGMVFTSDNMHGIRGNGAWVELLGNDNEMVRFRNMSSNTIVTSFNGEGKINTYGGVTPANGRVLVGNGTAMELMTVENLSVGLNETPITTNTTITPSNLYTFRLVDATAGNVTITINAGTNQMVKVKRVDNSVNTVTVVNSAGLIDGQGSIPIPQADLVTIPNVLPVITVLKGATNAYIAD